MLQCDTAESFDDMRVVLKVLNGSQVGRKILLDPNQVLQIGRTAWADISVPEDTRLSGVHFQLRADSIACYLHDLSSRNGTQVNGESVAETVLHNGDEIQAGNTRFIVHIEGDHPEQAAPVSKSYAEQLARSADLTHASFTSATIASGLTRCSGRSDEISPAQLAAMLANVVPLMLIADTNRIADPRSFAQSPTYLYNWLNPVVQENMSPILVEGAAHDDWPLVVEEAWGHNTVICCFVRPSFDQWVSAMRAVAQSQPSASDPPDDEANGPIVGIGWPGVLRRNPRFPDGRGRGSLVSGSRICAIGGPS